MVVVKRKRRVGIYWVAARLEGAASAMVSIASRAPLTCNSLQRVHACGPRDPRAG